MKTFKIYFMYTRDLIGKKFIPMVILYSGKFSRGINFGIIKDSVEILKFLH